MVAGNTVLNKLSPRSFVWAATIAVVSLVLSAAALVGTYLVFFDSIHPEFRVVEETSSRSTIEFKGNSFRPVVFQDSSYEGEKTVITELAAAFPTDHAILVRPVLLKANRFPFLELLIEGLQPGVQIYLFWKSSESGSEPHYLELDLTQRHASLHNLLRSEHWQGTITEVAIGFFGELRGEPIRLEQVRLKTFDPRTAAQLVWQEWTNFAPWTQSSVNSQRGISRGALVYPNLAATSWVVLATLLAVGMWLLVGKITSAVIDRQSLLLGVATCWLITWVFVDGIWQYRLIQQNTETLKLFSGKTEYEKMARDWDGALYQFARTIREQHLPKGRQTIGILSIPEHPGVWAGRLRYHLLPEHHGNLHWGPEQRQVDQAKSSYRWFIFIGDDNHNFESDLDPLRSLGLDVGENVTLVLAHRNYALYKNKLRH